MGQAKRCREMIGAVAGTFVDIRTGASSPTRYSGRLGEFLTGIKPKRDQHRQH